MNRTTKAIFGLILSCLVLLQAQTSVAGVPAMPNAPLYPISSLYLYQTWTRASYKEAFGVQPPPFDATKPVKEWFATDATDFTVFDSNSKTFVPLKLDAA